MEAEDIKKVAVIGACNMGHQISTLCAIKGYETVCTDVNIDVLSKTESFVERYLPGRVEKGRLSEEQANHARNYILFSTNLEESVKEADLVIEA